MPGHGQFQILFPLLNTLVTGIAKDIGFVTMQQRLGLRYIMHIGRGSNECVNGP